MYRNVPTEGIRSRVTDPNALITRLEKIEADISSLKADLRSSATSSVSDGTSRPSTPGRIGKTHGQHFVEDATGATIYLGSHSDTPLALGCRQVSGAEDIALQSMMMDQFIPRAYPFTGLWGPDAQVNDVCETLPEVSDIIRYVSNIPLASYYKREANNANRYWQIYQTTVYPFYPALVTIDQFGPSLFTFLDQSAPRGQLNHTEEPNPSWFALLFAILACGVQFSDDPIQERDLRSKVLSESDFFFRRWLTNGTVA